MRILGPIATVTMTWAFGTLLLVWLSSGCLPQPTQPECAKYRDCRACVSANCGWCDSTTGAKVGCYTMQGRHACFETVFVPYCSADVTDPGTYQKRLPSPDAETGSGPR